MSRQQHLGITHWVIRESRVIPLTAVILVPMDRVRATQGKFRRNSRGCVSTGKPYKPSKNTQRFAHGVFHMSVPIILASGSSIRAQAAGKRGVPFSVQTARVDEESAKRALLAEDAPPRDIADALAEMKARKVSDKNPGAMVLGCDQVLDFRRPACCPSRKPQKTRWRSSR